MTSRWDVFVAAILVPTGVVAVVTSAAFAQGDGGTMADAERSVQAYLAMWSHDDGVSPASVDRFYAPRVVYYGHAMSRAQVLADKRAYIRRWPHRLYEEVPGSFAGRCNASRSACKVSVTMAWRRSSHGGVSTGRARLDFVFVPAEGTRKIARESARILDERVRQD